MFQRFIVRCFFIVFSPIFLYAQAPSFKKEDTVIKNYIARYKDLAMSEMKRTGMPAAIKLAQGIIETQAGTSELVLSSNNHFGLKCKRNWQGERVFHDDDEKGECFRKYAADSISYRDQSDFLRSSQRYQHLFTRLDPLNYRAWAEGLRKAGYATNPRYIKMLITKIEDWGLQRYSLQALRESGKINSDTYQQSLRYIVFRKSAIYEQKNVEPGASEAILTAHKGGSASAKNLSNTLLADANTPTDEYDSVFEKEEKPSAEGLSKSQGRVLGDWLKKAKIKRINHKKAVFVPKGASLLAIAMNYNIHFSDLLMYNDFKPDANITLKEQYIFITPKRSRSSDQYYHIVQPNESLYDIAQMYGVYLNKIRQYNYLSSDMEPKAEEKIYLRGMAPKRPQIF